MGSLESWLQSAVVVAVLLYVWRRIDIRLDRMEERHRSDPADLRSDLADLRTDLTQRMDSLDARLVDVDRRVARVEGALIGPWRPPADDPPPAPVS